MCSLSRIVTSGLKAKPIKAQATQPTAVTRRARCDAYRRQATCATMPIHAAMIAERPRSGWSRTVANAPACIACAAPSKPYTSSVASTWPLTAATATTDARATESAAYPTIAKPSSDGSHGRSATAPLVSNNQTFPAATARGVAASDDRPIKPARFANVTAAAAAVGTAIAPSRVAEDRTVTRGN